MIRAHPGVLGAMVLALLLPPTVAPADVLHVYDRLNRLRATVDTTANDSSIWTYDAVGNVLTITRHPATQTTILELPAEAVAGACGVRILGIGFSATPSQNTVTVNGVAATVQSATATELVVCLGGSTTSGSVVVTTPTGSDTSDGPLPVQAAPAVPTVTGFTPGIAVWGTPLSVTGTNFDPGPGLTRVRLGATSLLTPVSGVTASSLTATAPPGTTSGRLTLTTPAGAATAPSDLFVPPAPYTASDVAVTARWTLGTSQGVTLPPTKQGLFVFDGAVGQLVCVRTVFTSGYGDVVKGVYLPSGAALFPPYSGGDTVIELAPLSVAGTYQVQMRNASPGDSAVGTLSLLDASDQLQGPIPTDGTATPLSFPTPCYRAGRTFVGTAGQRVSLQHSGSVNGTLTLAPPTGAPLVTTGVSNGGSGFVEPVTLPEAGTYTWWGDPAGSGTGTLTLQLYAVTDVETPITPGGAPVTATITIPGQRVALTFSGTAGQRASVLLDTLTTDGTAWVAQPDGTTLGSVQSFSLGQTRFFDTPVFPTTGTYRVWVDPNVQYTGSARVTLWTFVDATASGAINGGPVPLTITTPGQNATVSVPNGTADQLATVTVSGNTVGLLTLTLVRPDGTAQASTASSAASFSLPPQTLAVVGTYTVVVDPSGAATGSLSVEVTSP